MDVSAFKGFQLRATVAGQGHDYYGSLSRCLLESDY
jgi:hypothetical protein